MVALPPPRGRVAVFGFGGDDDAVVAAVRARVIRVLRSKGLKVITDLRPVDSAEQYREMAVTLDLAAYIDGEVHDSGEQAQAILRVRSAVSGQRVASAQFSSEPRHLSTEVAKTLWPAVEPALSRVCAEAAKPRTHERTPMRIEAGTPIENTPPSVVGEGT